MMRKKLSPRALTPMKVSVMPFAFSYCRYLPAEVKTNVGAKLFWSPPSSLTADNLYLACRLNYYFSNQTCNRVQWLGTDNDTRT